MSREKYHIVVLNWVAQGKGGRMWITSLNSHFCSNEKVTKCWYGAKEARVWIKVCNIKFQENSMSVSVFITPE